ncbi:hypothetical protein E2C01_036465 [Portunus trituberculatus]|uniref:Uncharacterized protein n=1 Tax=Portunus trituberculatus TaxID=210409 RepID=A0A5B7FE91_PORTR|nr:hypothetical protein [Portunus trituberculatus]
MVTTKPPADVLSPRLPYPCFSRPPASRASPKVVFSLVQLLFLLHQADYFHYSVPSSGSFFSPPPPPINYIIILAWCSLEQGEDTARGGEGGAATLTKPKANLIKWLSCVHRRRPKKR